MRKILLLLFVVCIGIVAKTQDQKEVLDQAAAKMIRERMASGAQEINLHLDKPYYPGGSTIWFRVYVYNPVSGKATMSAKIYVDIINQHDSLVSRTLLNTAGNELDGGIFVSGKWKEGPYQVKVYTQEMVEDPNIGKPLLSSVYIFEDDKRSPAMQSFLISPSPGISFTIEGGNLINGMINNIAIRSFDENGDPLTVSGYVKDERNNVVETFKSTMPGYAKCGFSPSKNRSYQLVVVMPDKTEKTFPLSSGSPNGWQLSLVKSTKATVTFRVAQGDSLYLKRPVSYLLGVTKTSLGFASIGNGVYEVNVPLDKFPDGIASFYLVNSDQQIVSQRQIRVNRNDPQLTITPNKTSYGPRELVNLDIDLKDGAGVPMSGVFSVSVTDNRWVGQPAGSSALATDLDDLRLLAEPIGLNLTKGVASRDSGIIIAGRVLLKNEVPASSHIITLISTKQNILLTDTTDAGGHFSFPPFGFYDKMPFIVQVTDLKGQKPAFIVVADPPGSVMPTAKMAIVEDSSTLFRAYQKSMADSFLTGPTKGMLEEIVINGKSNKKDGKVDNQKNKFTHMITGEQLDKLGLSNTVNAVLMLPGVILMNGRLTIRGGMGGTADARGRSQSNEPLIITDGVPASTDDAVAYLNSINPQSIESIEVMTGSDAAQYGTRGATGVILIKTANILRNPIQNNSNQKEMQYIFPLGYHQRPDFYMPRYDLPAVREASFTDNRSTIYWNGELLADKTGKAKCSFYAADAPSSYSVRVTGISSRGDLLDKIIRIERK